MKNKLTLLGIVACIALVAFWQLSKKPKTILDDTIIVGTELNFPPFSFEENGEATGFDIDLIKLVCKKLGKKIELKATTFDALIPAAQIGSIQVIACGMTPAPERAERLLFTKPYLTGDPLCILTLATHEPINNVDALRGKHVAVPEGFTADFYMSKVESVELTRLQTIAECFLALTSGRVEALAAAQNTITPFFAQKNKADFAITTIPETSESCAMGVSKKHAELLPKIQAVLDELEQDGTIKALKEKWKLN